VKFAHDWASHLVESVGSQSLDVESLAAFAWDKKSSSLQVLAINNGFLIESPPTWELHRRQPILVGRFRSRLARRSRSWTVLFEIPRRVAISPSRRSS
jgi:hypothetical protein